MTVGLLHVVSTFCIEGVCGRRRQGLDHTQLKHLKDVLHNEHNLIGCSNKHVKTPSQLLAASSLKGYMVVGAKAQTTHNLNTSRVFYTITLKEQQSVCVSVLA